MASAHGQLLGYQAEEGTGQTDRQTGPGHGYSCTEAWKPYATFALILCLSPGKGRCHQAGCGPGRGGGLLLKGRARLRCTEMRCLWPDPGQILQAVKTEVAMLIPKKENKQTTANKTTAAITSEGVKFCGGSLICTRSQELYVMV